MLKFKNVALLATTCLLLFSCYVSKPVSDNQNVLNEHLTFKINLVEEGKSIAQGRNSFISPEKGDKFVFVHLTTQNSSDQTQKLNFNDFYLLDTLHKTKRKLDFVMLTSAVNLWGDSDSSVKGNSKKSRKLVFSFPKNQNPSVLFVNNKMISIPYSK